MHRQNANTVTCQKCRVIKQKRRRKRTIVPTDSWPRFLQRWVGSHFMCGSSVGTSAFNSGNPDFCYPWEADLWFNLSVVLYKLRAVTNLWIFIFYCHLIYFYSVFINFLFLFYFPFCVLLLCILTYCSHKPMHQGLPITCHCHSYLLTTHTILLLPLLLPV